MNKRPRIENESKSKQMAIDCRAELQMAFKEGRKVVFVDEVIFTFNMR